MFILKEFKTLLSNFRAFQNSKNCICSSTHKAYLVTNPTEKFAYPYLKTSRSCTFGNFDKPCFSGRGRILFSTSACRFRKKTSKKYVDDDLEEEDEDADEIDFDDKKTLKSFQGTSTRIDLLLKNAFNLPRRSIDQAFYESRVIVNGQKVSKKSQSLKIGDEADIVHGFSPENPKFLLISRIELLSVDVIDPNNLEEGIRIKLRRYKNITVQNYKNPWKSSTSPAV